MTSDTPPSDWRYTTRPPPGGQSCEWIWIFITWYQHLVLVSIMVWTLRVCNPISLGNFLAGSLILLLVWENAACKSIKCIFRIINICRIITTLAIEMTDLCRQRYYNFEKGSARRYTRCAPKVIAVTPTVIAGTPVIPVLLLMRFRCLEDKLRISKTVFCSLFRGNSLLAVVFRMRCGSVVSN